MGDGFVAHAESIDGSANLLIEIAGLLYEGRLDDDIATMARIPRVHAEVSGQVRKFAKFADDQYQDLVLLLIALSTKLKQTGQAYVAVDAQHQADLEKILTSGHYVAPKDR